MPNNGYNLGFDDVKRFGDISQTPQRTQRAAQPDVSSSFMESIFNGEEIDMKKIMMLQMAQNNPMMMAMLLKGDGDIDMKQIMMMSMAQSNPLMAAMLMKKYGKSPEEIGQAPKPDNGIGFRGLEKTDKTPFLNDKAEVADVKPAQGTKLSETQQEIAQRSGIFQAKKDSIAIYTANGDQTALLAEDEIIRDGGIDIKKAKEKYKEAQKQTESHLADGGTSILDNKEDDQVLDSAGSYKLFGIDTKSVLGEGGKHIDILSSKGSKQLDELERVGIATRNGEGKYTILASSKFTPEQTEYLQNQQKDLEHREALGAVVDGKADVAVKTGEIDRQGQITDKYQVATLDKKGNITGIDEKKDAREKAHSGDIEASKPQLQIVGLKSDRMAEVAKVNKDGSIEIDADKLSSKEYAEISKNGKISYDGSAPLTLKSSKEGRAMQIELTGGANTVNLRGKASAAISTQGEELQVNGESGTKITQIKAENAKHLVVKGGTLEDNLGTNNNLEAVKIENATLTKGLYVDNSEFEDKDVALNISNTQVKSEGVHVSTRGNADIKAQDSKLGDVDARAGKLAVTLAKTEAEDVKLNGDAVSFKGFRGSKAETLKVKADDFKGTYNGINVDKTDLSEVSDKTAIFVSKDSDPGKIKLKDKASADDVELLGEDAKTAEKLKDKTDIEAKKVGREQGDVSQEQLFKNYFDFNDDDIRRFKQDLNKGTPDYQSYGHGSTPGGDKSTPWWANAMAGWNMGGQVVNSIYGNPYGIQQPPRYNPWMYNGGYYM